MKAIQVHETGGPEVLRLEEVQQPRPGAGQILVEVRAIGVNPVETYLRAGRPGSTSKFPYTPGHDAAGVVSAMGAGVSKFEAGDRVYTSGTLSGAYAEFTLCVESRVHPLPARVSFEHGAAMNTPYATAYLALHRSARAIPGETVLIHGASGGVGVAAIQIARAAGLEVIGTAGSPRGLELVRQQGAPRVLNHNAPGYMDELLKATGGRGVDIILEMLANKNLNADLSVLAKRGRVVVIGSRGPIEINPREAMIRNASILGFLLYNATEDELASCHSALGHGLEIGTLNPVIGERIPLAEAPRSHVKVMEPGAFGKIVLIP